MDIYGKITDRIIARLESGTIPWRRPWKNGMPINYVTRKEYRGVNLLLLPQGGEWLTFLQCKDKGGKVKKGEKGEMIVYAGSYTPKEENLSVEDREAGITSGREKSRKFLRHSTVFHISQCEGIESRLEETDNPNPDSCPDQKAETTLKEYVLREGIRLELVGTSQRAYYSPEKDMIRMPTREKFSDNAGFYGTAFHEAAHSTGHRDRLDRIKENAAFGTGEYSREELVAEIAAAYLCNLHGLETESGFDNSAAYIRAWLAQLRNDTRLIVQVASAAQKATDYILGKKTAAE